MWEVRKVDTLQGYEMFTGFLYVYITIERGDFAAIFSNVRKFPYASSSDRDI